MVNVVAAVAYTVWRLRMWSLWEKEMNVEGLRDRRREKRDSFIPLMSTIQKKVRKEKGQIQTRIR